MNTTISQTLCLVVFLAAGCAVGPLSGAPSSAAPAAAGSDTAPADEPPPTGKLPDQVTPTLYDLTLAIDPNAPRFSGTVRIAVTLAQKTHTLWLHGQDL